MLKKYIINDIIEFNADECVLVYINTGDAIPLTLSASRLLEYFVNSGGIILTRESLLENVWSKYDLTASGNNLNQYVSVLRRTLAGLGIHNFIDTLPKVGFKLNPAVTITLPPVAEMEGESPPTDIDGFPAPVEPAPPLAAGHQRGAKRNHQRHLALFGGLALMIILGGLSYSFWSTSGAVAAHTITLPASGKCQITFMRDLPEAARARRLQEINAIIKENDRVCDKERRVYFVSEKDNDPASFGRTLLSLCHIGGKQENISCENFYYYNRKTS